MLILYLFYQLSSLPEALFAFLFIQTLQLLLHGFPIPLGQLPQLDFPHRTPRNIQISRQSHHFCMFLLEAQNTRVLLTGWAVGWQLSLQFFGGGKTVILRDIWALGWMDVQRCGLVNICIRIKRTRFVSLFFFLKLFSPAIFLPFLYLIYFYFSEHEGFCMSF